MPSGKPKTDGLASSVRSPAPIHTFTDSEEDQSGEDHDTLPQEFNSPVMAGWSRNLESGRGATTKDSRHVNTVRRYMFQTEVVNRKSEVVMFSKSTAKQ